jgi:hypothetical protein
MTPLLLPLLLLRGLVQLLHSHLMILLLLPLCLCCPLVLQCRSQHF